MRRLFHWARLCSLCVVAIGCGQNKSYLRHPLVRQLNVIAGPVSEPETATQAEPYPPARPTQPDEFPNVATVRE